MSETSISGTVLSWFNRQFFICMDDNVSDNALLKQGVPHDSVLGPVFLNIFILPLDYIIHRHGITFHCYTAHNVPLLTLCVYPRTTILAAFQLSNAETT